MNGNKRNAPNKYENNLDMGDRTHVSITTKQFSNFNYFNKELLAR